MKIQLLHNKDCHTWNILLSLVREAIAAAGLDVEPEVILIENDEAAAKWRFAGSPQLLIDGKDVDPMADKITNYHASGCRIYLWQGKVYEYPPKELILEALNRR